LPARQALIIGNVVWPQTTGHHPPFCPQSEWLATDHFEKFIKEAEHEKVDVVVMTVRVEPGRDAD